MIALFFEVLPRPEHEATYFEMAAKLKPALDASGGLEFLDRSRSASRPGWFLSHQFWQDDASMTRWRVNPAHHRAQACGRTDILSDYRLRVGQVIASVAGDGAVSEHPLPPSAAYNDPTRRTERFLVSVTADHTNCGVPQGSESFKSVYDTALVVGVVPVPTAAAGLDVLRWAAGYGGHRYSRLCLISRDYGMFDRHEAPQYFEPVTLA
jgi:heme-degrading monooxygenase HmoA